MDQTGEAHWSRSAHRKLATGSTGHLPRPVPAVIRRLALRIVAVLADVHRAQVRLTQLRLAPDSYLLQPGAPPGTYAEFLCRTRGPLIREPPFTVPGGEGRRGGR